MPFNSCTENEIVEDEWNIVNLYIIDGVSVCLCVCPSQILRLGPKSLCGASRRLAP